MDTTLNDVGAIQATDSLASNMYLRRGLTEGWASIDPETGFAQFNRKLAYDFDSQRTSKRKLRSWMTLKSWPVTTRRWRAKSHRPDLWSGSGPIWERWMLLLWRSN